MFNSSSLLDFNSVPLFKINKWLFVLVYSYIQLFMFRIFIYFNYSEWKWKISSSQIEFLITFKTNFWSLRGDLNGYLHNSSQELFKVTSSTLHASQWHQMKSLTCAGCLVDVPQFFHLCHILVCQGHMMAHYKVT